jgi:tetraacyldisaccharide 4'-kinase
MEIRNFLYNRNILKSFSFDPVVISIGNITLGGTGKTPVSEYLIRLLKDRYPLVVLSRGYKRKTRGYRLAGEKDDARSIGDEPFQFYFNFGKQIRVAVSEDRLYAIPHLLFEYPDTRCIIMDDAFQQRQLKPAINILLNDYSRPFYNDQVLPAGYLRESRRNARRADIIIVTKCPENLPEEEKFLIIKRMQPYLSSDSHVFFSYIQYAPASPVWNENLKMEQNVILVTAIARPESLVSHIRKNYNLIRHFQFADHHFFTANEINRILEYFKNSDMPEKVILFTEKDIARIRQSPLEKILKPYPVFFQPITYNFVENGAEFDRLILESVESSLNEN